MSSNTPLSLPNRFVLFSEVLVLGWLGATENLSSPIFLILGTLASGLVLAVTSMLWPFGALSLLALTSAMPRFTGTLFGLHVRPEHVGIGFVVGAVLFQALRGRIRIAIRLRRFDYFLLAYVFLNFFSSAFTSPEPRMTLRWATMHGLVIIPYFLLRLLADDEESINRAFHIVLWSAAAESVYGIICFLFNRGLGTTFGVEIGQYGSIPGIYGTQYEANLFGSFTACAALMFFVLFLFGDKSKTQYAWGFLVTFLGGLVSLSRAVMLAFPAVLLVVVWIALKRGRLQLRSLLPFVVAIAILLLVSSPLILGFVQERFSTIDVSDLTADDTTAGRIIQMAVAVQDVQEHPWLGTGTASFQIFFNWMDYQLDDSVGWIGNTPLRILHDTGIVGLSVFLTYLGSLILAGRQALRVANHRLSVIIIALEVGLLFYAITFQSTEASLLSFTWIHVGCLAAAIAIIQSGRSQALDS